jgi:hypothetical protein
VGRSPAMDEVIAGDHAASGTNRPETLRMEKDLTL